MGVGRIIEDESSKIFVSLNHRIHEISIWQRTIKCIIECSANIKRSFRFNKLLILKDGSNIHFFKIYTLVFIYHQHEICDNLLKAMQELLITVIYKKYNVRFF